MIKVSRYLMQAHVVRYKNPIVSPCLGPALSIIPKFFLSSAYTFLRYSLETVVTNLQTRK
jgi:hypothetical protein